MAFIQHLRCDAETANQFFPAGTIGGAFRFTIQRQGGGSLITRLESVPTSRFDNVTPGVYDCTACRLDSNDNVLNITGTDQVTVTLPSTVNIAAIWRMRQSYVEAA